MKLSRYLPQPHPPPFIKVRYFIVFILFLILIVIIGGAFFVFSNKENIKTNLRSALSALFIPTESPFNRGFLLSIPDTNVKYPKLISPRPEIIKAVYLTSWSAGRRSKIDYVINLARTTEINAVVIDIKDFSGYIAYDTQVPEAAKYNAEKIKIPNIDQVLERLHGEGIYIIARITVFQDPVLAWARPDLAVYRKFKLMSVISFLASTSLWLDNLKLAWVDPASKEVWDYNAAIAKDAAGRGFDELNFDYVRFPTDGNLSEMGFPFWNEKTPRHLIIRDFFKTLRQELPDKTMSVDLFGLTTINRDDLGVGQIIEDAYEYFDYICPMVYPSHYARGFLGYQNPARYPYEVVRYSLEKAQKRLIVYKQIQEVNGKKVNAQLRPWLQDFNLGAFYDAGMVRSEIQAVYDALGENFNGFMLWNPSNIYTGQALEPAGF